MTLYFIFSAMAAAASVEAEVRATEGGLVPLGSATPEAAVGGGRPIRLGYSIGNDRRGLSRRAHVLP
jgi:hypothetical protein